MPALPVKESLKSFVEMIRGYSAEQAVKEADRCVECGICVAECPAHMDIPGYIRAVREGNIDQGMRLLYETNPFPASCGRICTHRCEEVCAVGHTGDSIAIRWLKRYIADQVELADYSKALPAPARENRQKSCRHRRRPRRTHRRLLPSHARPRCYCNGSQGPCRRYAPVRNPGIPAARTISWTRISNTSEAWVCVSSTEKLSIPRPSRKHEKDYDAVFFSTGLNEPYRLGVDGEDHPRVLSGLTFWTR